MRFLCRSSLIAITVFMLGCASASSSSDDALAKAASDLNCPTDQVTVASLGDNSYGARGCGRFVAYESYGPRTLARFSSGR